MISKIYVDVKATMKSYNDKGLQLVLLRGFDNWAKRGQMNHFLAPTPSVGSEYSSRSSEHAWSEWPDMVERALRGHAKGKGTGTGRGHYPPVRSKGSASSANSQGSKGGAKGGASC